MLLSNVHGIGLASDRPAASTSNVGNLYFSTDTLVLERSNGTSWDAYSGAGGGSLLSLSGVVFNQTVPGDSGFHICNIDSTFSAPNYCYDNTSGAWDNSAKTFTVPTTGIYAVSATISGASIPTAGDAAQLTIHKGDAPLWTMYDNLIPYQYCTNTAYIELSLTAGDVIDLRCMSKPAGGGDRNFHFILQISKK